MSLTLTERWRITDPLQYRGLHALGSGRFLLSGGLHSPTAPKDRLACGMAVIDFDSHRYVWQQTLPSHQPFTSSCATASLAIGVIPHAYKSDHSGPMAFGIVDGKVRPHPAPVNGVVGVVALAGDTWAYAGSVDGALVTVVDDHAAVTCHLPHEDALRIRSLTRFSETRFLTTLQRVRVVDGRGMIDFVHQMRRSDGSVMWEHVSKNDTLSAGLDHDEVLSWTDAGDTDRTVVECLDARNGSVRETLVIPTSLASLVHCRGNHLLFCNPRYELCLSDRKSRRVVPIAAFPRQTPGWMAISVAEPERTVLVSKVDNFLAPQTTLAAFTW